MENKVRKILLNIGLSNNEVEVYLAILKLGKSNISTISKFSGIKRPTAYLAVARLLDQNMIIINKNNNRPIYEANDPQNILISIHNKENKIISILPEIRNLSRKIYKPYVEIFEGFDGIKQIYKEILDTSYHEEVLVYGTVEAPESSLTHEKMFKMWLRMIKQKPVILREILDQNKACFDYAKKIYKNKSPGHHIRFIPNNFEHLPYKMKILEGDNIIYSNKIAFFSSYNENLYVIVIAHENVVKIYKNLFEMSWEMAEEY